MASQIVVLGFDSQYAAEGMFGDVQKWHAEGVVVLEDAVIASAGPGGRVEIQQTHREGGKFTLRGGGAGLLAGLLVGGPIGGIVGGVIGMAGGAITAGLRDYGLDDHFIERASEWVQPNTSALFLLVKEANADQVLEKLGPFQATVLSTNLPPEQEQRLRKALEEEEFST